MASLSRPAGRPTEESEVIVTVAQQTRRGPPRVPPPRPSAEAPPGATVIDGGVNFSLFSRTAAGVELVFFDRDDATPSRVVRIDPATNRTYHYWHVFVPRVSPSILYAVARDLGRVLQHEIKSRPETDFRSPDAPRPGLKRDGSNEWGAEWQKRRIGREGQ